MFSVVDMPGQVTRERFCWIGKFSFVYPLSLSCLVSVSTSDGRSSLTSNNT